MVSETKHLRIMFWDLGPTWDVWCWEPSIYELFLGFWTHLGCLVLETKHLRNTFGFWNHLGCLVSETTHLRIIFRIWDPPGMFGVRSPTFTNLFLAFGPDLGCLVSDTQHLRIIFGI